MVTVDHDMKRLERDFNNSELIDLRQYQNILSTASVMGFATIDALEAAIVCGTYDNMALITDYILAPDSEKKKKYDERKKELSKKDLDLSPEKEKLIDEIKKLTRELQQEHQKQSQLEQELKERTSAVSKIELYVEFLRGIVADEIITESEFEKLQLYRQENDIDEDAHLEALNILEMRPQDLEDYRKQKQITTNARTCVNCHKEPKEFVVFDCMHVCLCEGCAKELQAGGSGPGQGCPVCDGDITKIEKVFAD